MQVESKTKTEHFSDDELDRAVHDESVPPSESAPAPNNK